MKTKEKKITAIVYMLKIFCFAVLLLMSLFFYYVSKNFYLGNDMLLAAAVYIMLSRMDKI